MPWGSTPQITIGAFSKEGALLLYSKTNETEVMRHGQGAGNFEAVKQNYIYSLKREALGSSQVPFNMQFLIILKEGEPE